jgi:hypothetical protein
MCSGVRVHITFVHVIGACIRYRCELKCRPCNEMCKWHASARWFSGFKNHVHFHKDYPNLHIQRYVCLTPHSIHLFQLFRGDEFYWSVTSEYRYTCFKPPG